MATAKKNNYITAEQIARVVKPKSIVGKKHYLYVHKRLDNDAIFYIGIATLDRGKHYYRATCTKKRNQFWKRVAAKTKYIVFIISESDDKQIICDQEKNYIKLFGKRCTKEGTLCNLTDGGEGLLGHRIVWTEEMKDKIRKANKERVIKDSTREKLRIALMKRGIINKKNYRMSIKKNNYVTADLDFAELQLAKWKKYLKENPYDKVEDRKEMQMTKTGGSFYTVVQTKEAIQKSLRDTTKEYLAMVEIVNKLREADEAKKVEARGKQEVTDFESGNI